MLLKSFILLMCMLSVASSASIVENFLSKASNFWPGSNDVSKEKELKKLPKIIFELPHESEEFIKEGLQLIDAPREALDVCTHRVIHNLKKNCNQLNLEEIGKLSVMMLNCQLEIEGRKIFPCKPEMTLQQCTMGMNAETHQAYSYMTHRAVGICSALKQDQYRALTEITVNRLMQAAQYQVSALNEALKTQRRLNDMGNYNFKELNENDIKLKEKQAESLEKLQLTENLIEENLVNLEQELRLRQKAEEKLAEIEKSTEDISSKLEQQKNQLHEGHEKLLEEVIEISDTLKKNKQELLVHFQETLAFLENFKSFLMVFSDIGNAVKRVFNISVEIFPELGLTISDELLRIFFLNLVYFVCGMVFMLFINASNYTKSVLILLFAFNCVAAAFKTKAPLFPINFFVWLGLCSLKLMSVMSKRLSMIKFNMKKTFSPTTTSSKSHESDESEDEMSNYYSNQSAAHIRNHSTYRQGMTSKFPKVTPIGKVEPESKETSEEPQIVNYDYDSNFSLMDVTRQRSVTPIASTTVLFRPVTPIAPSGRPMTPTFRRLLRESISEKALERPATPFQKDMTGRVQCKSLTVKGVSCRNAAVVGFDKCRVHKS